MGMTEFKHKTADFHHPVSPEILQAVIDTGGVTDGSIIPDLRGMSPLEMRIKLTVQKYRPAYKPFDEARERAGSKRKRKKELNAIVKAERVLTFWLPWLSGDGVISADVVSLIQQGKLSEWLKHWPSQMGRRSELILFWCAEDLVKLFKQSGRHTSPWKKIGEAIAEGIPEAQPPHRSDLGNWIHKLVQRHQELERTLRKTSAIAKQTKVLEFRKRGRKKRSVNGLAKVGSRSFV
jgi:hypothetical protein